jgi:hypothetical protein
VISLNHQAAGLAPARVSGEHQAEQPGASFAGLAPHNAFTGGGRLAGRAALAPGRSDGGRPGQVAGPSDLPSATQGFWSRMYWS